MDAQWLWDWVRNTAWVAFLPLVFLKSLMGFGNGMAAEAMQSMPLNDVHDGSAMLPKLLIGTVVMLVLFLLTPVLFLGAYVFCAISLTAPEVLPGWGDAGGRGVNILLSVLIGGGLGFYTADRVLNRIDQYFGLDNRLACAVNVWMVTGGVYMAIKAAKVGKSIITRL